MTLKKLGRQPRHLGTLALFAALQPNSASSIGSAQQQQEFLTDLAQGLSESMANQARLHGWRVQALFKALVIELGGVLMVKDEDEGDLYFNDRDGKLKLPDLRLVLEDRTTVFIEVKNVNPAKRDVTTISRGELESLGRYTQLQQGRLLLAHYWSAINTWTLIDPVCLDCSKGRVEISLETAVCENEMSIVGDRHLFTVPPLTMTVYSDPDRLATLSSSNESQRQLGRFTIGAVEYTAGGRLLKNPEEERIAFALMHFGQWNVESDVDIEAGRPRALRYTFGPSERPEGSPSLEEQPFELVGSLSSIYSTMFNFATLTDDGRVAKLGHEPTPGGIGGLVPSNYFERDAHDLQLWGFELQPRREGQEAKRSRLDSNQRPSG
jgi:hypothetical protein